LGGLVEAPNGFLTAPRREAKLYGSRLLFGGGHIYWLEAWQRWMARLAGVRGKMAD
jgi:hypothetical protein